MYKMTDLEKALN